MSLKFQRKVEDFICEHCGAQIVGNGYTDHCPACLWGKHVDINPGDRSANCGGMMEPIGFSQNGQKVRIDYRCSKCGHTFSVKAAKEDDIDKIIALSAKL